MSAPLLHALKSAQVVYTAGIILTLWGTGPMSFLEGLVSLPWWGYVAVALALTQITIAAVTIFLHRHQSHRALSLHPVASHFFRLWLWLTTGMVTREWVAIHRKHHAGCETTEDPHSPQVLGLRKVLLEGAELYRQAGDDTAMLEKYGHGTPSDWIERRLYSRYPLLGIALMLVINAVCFGPIGITIWAVQMLWIPVFAAGVINGIGHYFGYRNFEVTDASRNIVPWGIFIGGEELHNNHHSFASSAKLSSRWWEFDIGWLYIRLMQTIGLAHVRKVPPELTCARDKRQIDLDTVRAVVNARLLVMAHFARDVLRHVHREELRKADRHNRDAWLLLKRARRLLVREPNLLDADARTWLQRALALNARLSTVYAMKQKLATVWTGYAATQDHLIEALQNWCKEAEATGIEALQQFAQRLRSYQLVPVPA